MTDPLFAAFDIGLVFALVLGLAIWQIASLRRGMQRDRTGEKSKFDREE